jgi:hypothetical protein
MALTSRGAGYAATANRLLQMWLAVRAVNLFIFYVSEHSALHTEARLLVQHLCDTTHNKRISGALIDCNQARTLLNTKSFVVTYALEQTIRALVLDCWRNATRELASLAKLLGLITTLAFTATYCVHNAYLGAQRLRYAREAYGETLGESLGFTRQLPSRQPRHQPQLRDEPQEALKFDKFD